jgi:hypothetical protein
LIGVKKSEGETLQLHTEKAQRHNEATEMAWTSSIISIFLLVISELTSDEWYKIELRMDLILFGSARMTLGEFWPGLPGLAHLCNDCYLRTAVFC